MASRSNCQVEAWIWEAARKTRFLGTLVSKVSVATLNSQLFLSALVSLFLFVVCTGTAYCQTAEPTTTSSEVQLPSSSDDQLLGSSEVPPPSSSDAQLPSSSDVQLRDGIAVSSRGRSLRLVDRELLLELVKLSRFNVKFHLAANYHQRWRTLTYPLGREAGTAVAFAGTVSDLYQQGKNLNHPIGISRQAVKNSIACGITGSAISASASSLELAQNTWVMYQAHRQGYSNKDAIQFVKERIAKLNSLFDERQAIVQNEPSTSKRRAHELETVLLQRIQQQLVFEFRTWSCHSRDQAWRENTFYTLDAAQNFTRMTAAILARRALKDPDLAGGGIVCALVANSVATINPLFRNMVGQVVRKHQDRKLQKEFACDRPLRLDGPLMEELHELQTHHPGREEEEELLSRALLLNQRSEKLDGALDRETREIERYRQIAQQQSISGPLIGLTGLTGSTLSAVAYFDYRDVPRTANKLSFSGRIVNVTGQAYALVNTPVTVAKGFRRNRRLRAKGLLPTQILEKRLEDLDKFEAQVKSTVN